MTVRAQALLGGTNRNAVRMMQHASGLHMREIQDAPNDFRLQPSLPHLMYFYILDNHPAVAATL